MGEIDYVGVFLSKLEGVRYSGGSWMARCPAHEDSKPSLHVSRGERQDVVFTCHAGCTSEEVLRAAGLSWEDITPGSEPKPVRTWTPYGDAVAVYDYVDEDGTLLYQVCRTAKKDFPQRMPDPTAKSGWRWKGSVRRVLYRLPHVIKAIDEGKRIYIVEGEKDVQAMERAGVVATCNPNGAGSWRPEYASIFGPGCMVTVVADKDKKGQAHARVVRQSLVDAGATVEIVEAPDGCKDASDMLSAGLKLSAFEVTCPADEEPHVELAPDLYDFLAVIDPPNSWVIPDLLERGDRLILTGFEGLGKSVLTRQLAIAAAAGVVSFTGEPDEPQRVLFIDCENPDRKARRHFAKLEWIARVQGFPVPKGMLRIIQRPAGIDLTTEEDSQWLIERVHAHKPALLVIGPFYRLHMADTNEERSARQVVGVLDRVRMISECALITEAHAGHAEAGKDRSVRPIGSSLLLRWPEFGYGLKPMGDADANGQYHQAHVVPWRGPREERKWPRQLTWASHPSDWPWLPPKPGISLIEK